MRPVICSSFSVGKSSVAEINLILKPARPSLTICWPDRAIWSAACSARDLRPPKTRGARLYRTNIIQRGAHRKTKRAQLINAKSERPLLLLMRHVERREVYKTPPSRRERVNMQTRERTLVCRGINGSGGAGDSLCFLTCIFVQEREVDARRGRTPHGQANAAPLHLPALEPRSNI